MSNTTFGTQYWNFKVYLKRWNEYQQECMKKIIFIAVESLLLLTIMVFGLMYLNNNYSNRYHLQTALGAMTTQHDNQMSLLDIESCKNY